jgi:acylphosphatase
VQGVGYRWFASKQAALLKLTGFAKNLSDGSVEVEVQGNPEQIESFLERLREGPRSASVSSVSREVLNIDSDETEFQTF